MHHHPRRSWLTKTTTITTRYARRLDQSVRPVILDASGLAALSVAGFHVTNVNLVVGWTVVGLSCFAFNWRVRDGRSS